MDTGAIFKTMIWKSIKSVQKRMAKVRIPPPLLNPLVRIFQDNHTWKTEWVEPRGAPCYFECTCKHCGLIRQTGIIGDPFPKYVEGNKNRKIIPFIRCEELRFKKMLK